MSSDFGKRSDGKWIRFHRIKNDTPPINGGIGNGIANTMITHSNKPDKSKPIVKSPPHVKRTIDKIQVELPRKKMVQKRVTTHDVDTRMNVADNTIDRPHPKHIPAGTPEPGKEYYIPPSKFNESELKHMQKMQEIERKRRNTMDRKQRTNTSRKRMSTTKKKVVKRNVQRRRT
jgi:hypothetical protein